MKVQTEGKTSLLESIKTYINPSKYDQFKDNATITNSLVNLAVQFNSVISSSIEIHNNVYYFQRINVKLVIEISSKKSKFIKTMK